MGAQSTVDVARTLDGALWVALGKEEGQPTRIARSTDNGETWSYRTLIQETDDVTQILGSQVTSGTLFAATSKGLVFLSTDNGVTWAQTRQRPPVLGKLYNIALSATGLLFAGDFDGGVFVSAIAARIGNLSKAVPQTASISLHGKEMPSGLARARDYRSGHKRTGARPGCPPLTREFLLLLWPMGSYIRSAMRKSTASRPARRPDPCRLREHLIWPWCLALHLC